MSRKSKRKTEQATNAALGWFRPTDTEEQRRARDEWLAQQAEAKRERDEARRSLFTAFEMWTICPHKICQRNKSCRGDTDECVMQRWRRTVPDEVRIYIGKVVEFVAREGMTVEQACEATDKDFKEREEILAQFEARSAAQSPSRWDDGE